MADSFENEAEAEPTITIKDYLKAVEEEELEADLVLGGDEGKECTYAKGYMKRQAVFSCLTCTPEGNAGVCTACCLSCHDGHEMVELWTKRNFRCDCGNSKFGEFYCKLLANKDVENSENAYNHNFKGTYCTCDLPYPDPDAEDQVEMIQCCICEDWFHEEHIGLQSSDEVPRDEEGEPLYEDFICQGCAVECSFLTHYAQTILVSNHAEDKAVVKESVASSEKIENDNPKVADADSLLAKCIEVVDPNPIEDKAVVEQSPPGTALKKIETGNCSLSTSVKVSAIEDKMPIDASTESSVCAVGIDLIRNQPTLENSNPMFLSKNWRDVLCRCKNCSDFYGQKGVGYLLDKEDTIAEYERKAKLKRNENMQKQEGVEQAFLNNLGHVEKIELLSGIADMKMEFSAFLESSDPSKAITPADIQQVFENLNKKRKRMP